MSKYIFILGVGRSGTSFLGELVSTTTSPIRFISEPFPGIPTLKNSQYLDSSFIRPDDKKRIESTCQTIKKLTDSDSLIEDPSFRIKRNEENANTLVIKEVHGLLAFPAIHKALNAKTIVITRNTLKSIDSHFSGPQKKRTYLIEEYNYIRKLLKKKQQSRNVYLDNTIDHLSPRCAAYFKRPKLFTTTVARQACITELLRQYLIAWTEKGKSTLHVTYEDLCLKPIEHSKRILNFMDLANNEKTISDIKKLTTDSNKGYYATNKISKEILEREYRFLSSKDIQKLNALIM